MRLLDPGKVDAVMEIRGVDVVPRPHAHPVVDRDRAHRRVRKYEAQGQRIGQCELRNDGHKVVAVGAQTVQPDDAGSRAAARFELDAGQNVGRHG